MSIPVYKLVISDKEGEQGVDCVSLVDYPAIEMNWKAFNKQQHLFVAENEEQRIVSGPLMIPDLPIYRKEKSGREYYVVFDADTIKRIVYRFFKSGFTKSVNMMHNPNAVAGNVYMVESFFIDSEKGKATPGFYGKPLPDGSWFGTYRVEDDAIWNDFIKTGQFNGFSVEGYFGEELVGDMEDFVIEQLRNVILN